MSNVLKCSAKQIKAGEAASKMVGSDVAMNRKALGFGMFGRSEAIRRVVPPARRRAHLLSVAVAVLALGGPVAAGDVQGAKRAFDVNDYFSIKRVTDLELSSDGRMLAYVVDTPSLNENRWITRVHVDIIGRARDVDLPEDVKQGRAVAWVPGQRRLAYLAERDGITQVLTFDIGSRRVTQHTRSTSPVVSFAFAPDGASLAYIAARRATDETFYNKLRNSKVGVLADVRYLNIQHFTNPKLPIHHLGARDGPTSEAWVQPSGADTAVRIDVPGDSTVLHWSPDSSRVSVVYSRAMAEVYNPFASSVGVYDVSARRFVELAAAYKSRSDGRVTAFAGGEWRPTTSRLLIRRLVMSNLWVDPMFPSVADVDASTDSQFNEAAQTWHPIGEYPPYFDDPIFPAPNATFMSEISSGRYGLKKVSKDGQIESVTLCPGLAGDSHHFSFSRNLRTVAFVNERISRPPEIFIAEGGRCRRLTALNNRLADVAMPNVREVEWKGRDGALVHGWLIAPSNGPPSGKPWPLVTLVHGGPATPVTDKFAGYFSSWPYPLEALAARGIAVFVPNYRGTLSYGRRFMTPNKSDGEPVEDIESGVEFLTQSGVADPARLGIAGHSHGVWLVSLLLSKTTRFRAASIAEGGANAFVKYDLNSEITNREIHDKSFSFGTSPYNDPKRYIELSGDLSLEKSTAALLAEAGAESLAPAMLGIVKAVRRAGAVGEFIIYPKTGHNVSQPQLMRESAERNLNWFAYWLKGEQDPAPSKAQQYARWRTIDEED